VDSYLDDLSAVGNKNDSFILFEKQNSFIKDICEHSKCPSINGFQHSRSRNFPIECLL
jgi:hypothetical protein